MSRLQRWLTLLLVWFVAHVAAIAPRLARCWVQRARRRALLLLQIRAVMLIAPTLGPPSTLKRCYDPRSRRAELDGRRVAGAFLRRALRRSGPADTARAIYRALTEDAARWIAHIARRLRRCFTKLRRAPALPRTRVRAVALTAQSTAALNSS
jgi:hypothetical protein